MSTELYATSTFAGRPIGRTQENTQLDLFGSRPTKFNVELFLFRKQQ